MKCTVVRRPTGLVNGQVWPAIGEVVDLPDHVAAGMIRAGDLAELVEEKVETATAPTAKVETAVRKTGKRN